MHMKHAHLLAKWPTDPQGEKIIHGKPPGIDNILNFLFLIGNGLRIREALRLQLDVQRRLHEQLELYLLFPVTFWLLYLHVLQTLQDQNHVQSFKEKSGMKAPLNADDVYEIIIKNIGHDLMFCIYTVVYPMLGGCRWCTFEVWRMDLDY
ncbi:MYB-CC type transcription factor [Spatholobus suberectus]|nr:MYB-CC type transcription factor [Spatholobus suberectus]